VAPLWAAKHLPFTDLPEHVAMMATLAHWFDPSWPDSHIYAFSGSGSPYFAYHAAGALLTYATGDALLANRVLLTATGLALPYTLRSLLRAVRGDERLAVFGCVAFWSRPLAIGFLPFMAAVPLAIGALAAAVRQAEAPALSREVGLAAATLLVFFVHLDPFLFVAAGAIAVNLTAHASESWPERIERLPRRIAWLLPAALAVASWLWRGHAAAGIEMFGAGPMGFLSGEQLASEFPAWSSGTWRSRLEPAIGIAQWAVVLAMAARRGRPEERGVHGLALRMVPFACVALLFVLLPFRVGITRMLNVRFAVLLLPTLAVALRPDHDRTTRALLAVMALLVGATAAHAAWEVHAAERAEIAGIDELLRRVRPGSRLLTLEFDRGSAFVQFPPWTKVGALHRLRGGGVASESFAQVPHWPVHYLPAARPPSIPGRDLEWHPCAFRNSFDGPYFDYVLVRGTTDPFRTAPPGPAWRRVERLEEQGPPWQLFERVPGEATDSHALDPGPCGPDSPGRLSP
jgi:hypothetical protein